MILYSDRDDHYSQRVRIVLAEKDISAEIKESKQDETPDEILSMSPYHKLPILVDRDLIIHDPAVMMEYLDERFPHPPLLPVYPVARANSRTLMLRIDREWCPLIDTLIVGDKPEKEELNNCSNYFNVEISNLKKIKTIITLGKVAFDNCVKFYKKNYNLNTKFKFIHGKSYSLPGNIRLVACYHPSPRNVNTKLISEKMIVDLFLKAKKISKV